MPHAPYFKLMPKQKAVKKVTKPKAKKLIPLMEPELAGDIEAPVAEPIIEAPVPLVEKLPKGVLKKEVVDVNGRAFNKLWHEDGTTSLELIG